MTRAGNEHEMRRLDERFSSVFDFEIRVVLMFADQVIQVCVNKIQARNCAPVTQNAVFNVLDFELLAHGAIFSKIKLRRADVVGVTKVFLKPGDCLLIHGFLFC